MPGLAESAYSRLREDIVTLRRAPGSTLREEELIEELAVGRTPVREALKRLQFEHLVEIAPRSATLVTDVAIADIKRVSEVRLVLEPEAARLAATRADKAWRADAQSLMEQLSAVEDIAAPHELMRLDEAVHRLVWRGAGNAYLESTLDSYFSLSVRIGYLVLGRNPNSASSIVGEMNVLRAVVDRRPLDADALMRGHILEFEREALYALDADS